MLALDLAPELTTSEEERCGFSSPAENQHDRDAHSMPGSKSRAVHRSSNEDRIQYACSVFNHSWSVSIICDFQMHIVDVSIMIAAPHV